MEILIKLLEKYKIHHSIVEVEKSTTIIGEHEFIKEELVKSTYTHSVYLKPDNVKLFEAVIKEQGFPDILKGYNMSWKIDESMRPIALKITKAMHAVHSIN